MNFIRFVSKFIPEKGFPDPDPKWFILNSDPAKSFGSDSGPGFPTLLSSKTDHVGVTLYFVCIMFSVTWPYLTYLLCVRRGRPVHGARRVPRQPVRHLCPECGGPGRCRIPAHPQPSLPGSHPMRIPLPTGARDQDDS